MEQVPGYNSINFVFGGANVGGPRIPYPSGARVPVNLTAFTLRMNVAQCPSDAREAITVAFGRANYAGCGGTVPVAVSLGCDGIFCKVEGTAGGYETLNGPPRASWSRSPASPTAPATRAAFSERIKGVGSGVSTPQ